MLKTLVIGGCLIFGGITYGGAKAYVDSKAGPGTFSDAVSYGSHSAAETYGEVPRAANDVVTQMKPGFTDLMHQGTGALNSATGGGSGSWDQPVDPSTQQPGGAP